MKEGNVKHFHNQAVLGCHHVSNRESWKLREGLSPTVRGRGGNAVSDGINEDDKVFRVVHDFVRSYELQQILGRPAQPTWPKNGVRFLAVQFADRSIAQPEVVDYEAAFEPKVAQLSESLRAAV